MALVTSGASEWRRGQALRRNSVHWLIARAKFACASAPPLCSASRARPGNYLMKLFTKLMVLVVLAALVAPFLIRGPDGQPIRTVDDVLPDAKRVERSLEGVVMRVERTANGLFDGDEEIDSAGMTRVVRWQDAQGVWHFAQDAPEGVNAEEIVVDPDTNLVQGMHLHTTNTPESPANSALPSSPSGYIEQAAALQAEALAIREASEARVEKLDALRQKAMP